MTREEARDEVEKLLFKALYLMEEHRLDLPIREIPSWRKMPENARDAVKLALMAFDSMSMGAEE
jgi:hypothetical protein